MTNTDVNPEPVSEPATIVNAPADTPATITPTQAARMLASLRKPKEQEQTQEAAPAEAAAAQESTAQAEDGAPPPEEATAETQEADPAELPPLVRPRSWSKERDDAWNALDRGTQEYLLDHDREASTAVRKAQNEAAEKLKGLTAKEQAVEQARQHYEAALPQLFQTLQNQQAGEFADVKTIQDVEKLAREDWPRYLQWDVSQKKMAAVAQEMQSAQQRQQQERLQQFTDFARTQDSLFVEKVPDMADSDKAAKLQKQARNVLSDIGFSDDELGKSWNGELGLSLRDHRMQLLIRDATLYRNAQTAVKTVAAKPVPPVQRPGPARSRSADVEAATQALNKQLDHSSGMKALRTAAELLAARRAAAR